MINPNRNHTLIGTVCHLPTTFEGYGSMYIQTTKGVFEAYGYSVVGRRPGRFKIGSNVTITLNYSIIAEEYTINHIKLNKPKKGAAA